MRAIYFLYNTSLFTHEFISPLTLEHKGFILFTSLPSPIPSRAYIREHYITHIMATLYSPLSSLKCLSFPFGFIPKTYLLFPFAYPFSMALSWLYIPFEQWLYINLALPLCLCLILCPCLSFALSLAYLSLFFSWLYCLSMYPIIHLYGISFAR